MHVTSMTAASFRFRVPAIMLCSISIFGGRACFAAADAAVDPAAMALLRKVERTMIGLKSYQAECFTTLYFPAADGKPRREKRQYASLAAAKPNKMHYSQWYMKRDETAGEWVKEPTPSIRFVCDGKTYWKQFGKRYRTDERKEPANLSTILEPWTGFYAKDSSPHGSMKYARSQGELIELRRTGTEQVDGVLCDKVFAHHKAGFQGESQEYWETWFIGRDGLVRRKVERIDFGGRPGYTRVASIRSIRLNAPIPATAFVYAPPEGVLSEAEYDRQNPPPKLLASGTEAPDFTALDIDKKPVRLSDLRGKVVVIDFWASWCGPCIKSMPHTQAVVKKLHDQGIPVVLLAVDDGEERDTFSAWVRANAARYPALRFVHIPPSEGVSSKLYNVTGIPTQYVLDAKGVVRASFVGFSGEDDSLEKAVRAAHVPPSP